MFNKFCKSNEEIGELLEYLVIGQCIPTKFKWLGGILQKPRIHLTWIDLSSTGKNQAMFLVEKISNEMGIIYSEYTDSTEAGLIGTSKRTRIKGTDVYEPVKGLLGDHNIIAFTEAESLFTGSYKETMIKTLQSAMDEPGKVDKKLSNIRIKYKTDTSIILVSTPFNKFNSILLNSGLLQRSILFKGNKSADDIMKISDEIDKDVINEKNKISSEDYEDYKNNLNEIIRLSPEIIKFDKECLEFLSDFTKKTRKKEEELETESVIKGTLFTTYLPRAKNNLFKLAVIDAIKNKENIVKKKNFLRIEKFILNHMNAIYKAIKEVKISNNDKLDDKGKLATIKNILIKKPKINTGQLKNYLLSIPEWNLGVSNTLLFLRNVEFLFKIEDKGNLKIWDNKESAK